MTGMKEQDLKARVVTFSTSEATIAELSVEIDGVTHSWAGTAKRDPLDEYNEQIGERLAVGRAFEKAARQLLRQGNGFVKSADDNRQQSEAAKLRPVPKRYRVIGRNPNVRRTNGHKALVAGKATV